MRCPLLTKVVKAGCIPLHHDNLLKCPHLQPPSVEPALLMLIPELIEIVGADDSVRPRIIATGNQVDRVVDPYTDTTYAV
jgi:hypothetical protein